MYARQVTAIVVEQLRKSYGDLEAVKGISLTVNEAEIFALLGPNGAGKTTTVEILEGYRARSSGTVEVLGFDPAHRPEQMRERIGIVLQSAGVENYLTVAEVVDLYRGYYPKPRDRDEVLKLVGLEDRPQRPCRQAFRRPAASTRCRAGHLRRPRPALPRRADHGLRSRPHVVTRGPPSEGCATRARRSCSTTHFMDEAQALADRLAIMRAGEIVAMGTIDEIQSERPSATRIRFEIRAATPPAGLVPAGSRRHDGGYEVWSDAPVELLHSLTGWAMDSHVELTNLSVSRPSLEDTYLELTGELAEQSARE